MSAAGDTNLSQCSSRWSSWNQLHHHHHRHQWEELEEEDVAIQAALGFREEEEEDDDDLAMQAILGFREEEEVVVVVAVQAVLGFREEEEEDIVLTHRQGTWQPPWRWWSTSDGHSRRWWGSQVAGEWSDPCTRKPPRSRRDCSWRTWRCAPGTSRCWLWELGSRGTPSSSEDKCCGSTPESESRSLPPPCPTETTERRWLEAAFLLLHMMMMMISCCRCRQGHQHLLLREALGRRTGLMSQMMMSLL